MSKNLVFANDRASFQPLRYSLPYYFRPRWFLLSSAKLTALFRYSYPLGVRAHRQTAFIWSTLEEITPFIPYDTAADLRPTHAVCLSRDVNWDADPGYCPNPRIVFVVNCSIVREKVEKAVCGKDLFGIYPRGFLRN